MWTRCVGQALSAALAFPLAAGALQPRPAPAAGPPADLVLRNGRIVTLEAGRPRVQALAARGEAIVAVGDDGDVEALIGPRTEVIDLQGRLAVPGFVEGHGHFLSLGHARMNLDLTRARSWDDIVTMVREAAASAPPGQWIVGRGWHQEKWRQPPSPAVEGFPSHEALSASSPRNPVLLIHASGHAAIANAAAMERAGIRRETKDPEGGEILRLPSGEPLGVFRETAQQPLRRALEADRARRTPPEAEAESRRAVDLATRECLSKGVTSFQDAGSTFTDVDLLRRLAEEGRLGIRLWMMLREPNEALARRLPQYRIQDLGRRLTVRAIKRSIDGALGARGAWLLEPYADLPGSTGLNTTPVAEIEETARLARQHGFQLCVHAIGDRANRETLDLFERAFGPRGGGKALRWRIEHAQHLHPDDIPRFGRLGVIASMQGIHCTSDAPWAVQRLGEKRMREGAYVWRKLLQSGALVTNGTDAPVEDVSPIASYHASVSRRLSDGTVFAPDQRMTREEALRSYTIDAARAAFEEDVKGSLRPGKLADVVVLSRDILTVPEEEIPGTEVVYTILGGRVAWRR